MNGHPTLAELDQARTGEAAAETAAHLADCAECRAELARLTEFASRMASGRPEIVSPPDGFSPAHEAAVRSAIVRTSSFASRPEASQRTMPVHECPPWSIARRTYHE